MGLHTVSNVRGTVKVAGTDHSAQPSGTRDENDRMNGS